MSRSTITASVPTFRAFWWRVCSTHVITYFLAGLLAFEFLDYQSLYAESAFRHLMRPTTSAWVAAGPVWQLVRGTLFAVVLWPVAQIVLERGWLALWALLVGLAILGTSGPAPGSLEGVWFSSLPPSLHLLALPEVLLQTAAFSYSLVAWCRRPQPWMNTASGIAVSLIAVMSLLGVLFATPA